MKIKELDFTIRTHNALKQAGIHYVSTFCWYTEGELLNLRNLGLKSLSEIKSKLKAKNLKLS